MAFGPPGAGRTEGMRDLPGVNDQFVRSRRIYPHIFSPEPERMRSAAQSIRAPRPRSAGRSLNRTRFPLAATRLKIIDLETGDQPISPRTAIRDRFQRRDLQPCRMRGELERRGHRFHTRTDTEIVSGRVSGMGRGCFSRLRGMFAIALWTESRSGWCWRGTVWASSLYISRTAASCTSVRR